MGRQLHERSFIVTETIAHRIKDIARQIRWQGGGDDDTTRGATFSILYDIGEEVAALTAERDALLNLIYEAYEKLGGGAHPYASGVRDALGYVLRGVDKSKPTTTGEQG